MLLLIALALAAASPAPVADPTIVVTGIPMSKLKAAVDRCVSGGCPPKEDIDASIRYAEGLFRTGKYQDARRVLAGSLGRTKGAAKEEPIALSELHQATATVAMHEGEQNVVKSATFARARVLRDALPASAPEVLTADLGVGDLQARLGDNAAAAGSYARVVQAARAAGHVRIAAAAELRQAGLAHVRKRYGEATAILDRLAANTDPAVSTYRLAARILAARFARARGDTGATDALLAALAKEPRGAAPVLVWSPPLPGIADLVRDSATKFAAPNDSSTRPADLTGIGWVDIGYWIRPDGSVEDAELLRGNRSEKWAAPVVGWIGARRFASGGPAGGQFRVERFTYTADYDTPVGSLIRRRVRNPRYEHLDITGGAPPAPAS